MGEWVFCRVFNLYASKMLRRNWPVLGQGFLIMVRSQIKELLKSDD